MRPLDRAAVVARSFVARVSESQPRYSHIGVAGHVAPEGTRPSTDVDDRSSIRIRLALVAMAACAGCFYDSR
jgi:hypothetical protein